MNFEDRQPESYDAPKKSGRGWFAFCGIGCLILFLLCAVGAAIAWFTAGDFIKSKIDIIRLQTESIQMVIESDAIKEKLGEPVTPDLFSIPTDTVDGDKMVSSYNIDLKGPKGTGQLIIEYQINPGQKATRTKFEAVIDGETINLMESDEFNLNVGEPDDAESPADDEKVPLEVGG